MTNENNKNLNPIEQAKAQLNTPKTETRLVIETEDLYPDLAIKKSKLSPAARNKVVNHNKPYQSQNQESYRPCSYSGCPYSTYFDVSLSIEGNSRSWGRNPGHGTSFPGSWECRHNLMHTYYNAVGLFCAENNGFCKSAKNIISSCIEKHERGENASAWETIDSNWSKWSRYGFKVGVAVGAGFINPGAAIGIGIGAMGAGAIGQSACDSDRGKAFWGTVGGMGLNAVGTGISSGISGKMDKFIEKLTGNSKGFCEWKKVIDETTKSKLIENTNKITGPITEDGIQHAVHKALGYSYHSECQICNP